MRNGGNAVDAAVTMAGVLAVVRPHMNGVGGDAFALIFDAATGEVAGLNGSGRAGALAEPSFFREQGEEDTSVAPQERISLQCGNDAGRQARVHKRNAEAARQAGRKELSSEKGQPPAPARI